MSQYGSKNSVQFYTCAAANCDAADHLYKFPKNEKLAKQWEFFVMCKVANFVRTAQSRLCFRHFKPDDFHNYYQYQSNNASRLQLDVSKAVPTIQLGPNETALSPRKAIAPPLSDKEQRVIIRDALKSTLPQATTSRASADGGSSYSKPKDSPKHRSLHTQTGKLLVKPRRRSKAVQCNLLDAPPLSTCVDNPRSDHECSEHEYECESDEFSEMSSDEFETDKDYDPTEDEDEIAINRESNLEEGSGNTMNTKVIVDYDKLVEVLSYCNLCAQKCAVDGRIIGALVKVHITCLNSSCKHTRTWYSCPVQGQLGLINPLLCGAILFNGALPAKTLRVLTSIGVAVPAMSTYIKYQRNYLFGIIHESYLEQEGRTRAKLAGKPLDLSGDGRCDSMGHSAMYGLYTLMDCESNKIVASELVKVSETSNSNAMELEGLKRCINALESDGNLKISSITTDRHKHVAGYMKKDQPGIQHLYDRWHIAKGIKKKLCEAGKVSSLRKLNNWIKPVVNHLYYTISKTDPETTERTEMWLSILRHCVNEHTHPDNKVFKSCMHEDLGPKEIDGATYKPDWMLKDGKVVSKLKDVVATKDLIEGIGRASCNDTSQLESFHSDLNRNAPKMCSFSYHGMIARCQLTILHHNENCNRPSATKADGALSYTISRKKQFKQNPVLRVNTTPATYDYRDTLFEKLLVYISSGKVPGAALPEEPPTLASSGEQLSIEELIDRQSSRPGVVTKRNWVVEPTPEENRKRGRKRVAEERLDDLDLD